jgi:hypothetical protein
VNILNLRLTCCLLSAGFLLGLHLGLEYVPLKRPLTFTKLLGVISQKKKLRMKWPLSLLTSFEHDCDFFNIFNSAMTPEVPEDNIGNMGNHVA